MTGKEDNQRAENSDNIEQLSFFPGARAEEKTPKRKSAPKAKAEPGGERHQEQGDEPKMSEPTQTPKPTPAPPQPQPVKDTDPAPTPEETVMTTQEKEKIDFEASLSELEKVVRELDGEIKLDKALSLFEQGIKLSVQCEQFIKGAEQKIEILKKQADGSVSAEPFESEALEN